MARIVRRYWTGGRPSGVSFHRDIYLLRADNLTVTILPQCDRVRVYASGVIRRAQRDFPNMRAALDYAALIARDAPADLWARGYKARNAEAAFNERNPKCPAIS